MKKWTFSTLSKQLICAILFVQLVGCGTLLRGKSNEKIYRGVDTDINNTTNAFMWLFSAGVLPVFSVISMPFDAVIDTLLLPVDLAISNSPKVYKQPSTNYVPVFAVNMTGQPDVDYAIRKKSTGEILIQSRSSIIPQAGSVSGKLDKASLMTKDNPSIPPEPVTISWDVGTRLLQTESTDSSNITESYTPDDSLLKAASVIAIFFPCNRVMLVNYDSDFYNYDFIHKKAIQNVFQQLQSLSERSQCSASGQITLMMEGAWK
ncbi:hypothetical protein VH86_13145 [Pantoea sp. BL1]|uniref:YceK/YidQ family lipoprotein n=1 Tax=Pantoea sp. BL1 TaxID=1628190 RepID=UPI0005F7DF48|nr:YceK/YidQ family lipoprotein [Pantoea sp. BL1]KJV47909.1 hypothetical protein VH86_13145 [Pantoea sp. BL1]